MPMNYMLTACIAGTFASLFWVLTGGTLPSAFAVYVVSGNLLMLCMIVRTALRTNALAAKA